jgi:hypothetical protein
MEMLGMGIASPATTKEFCPMDVPHREADALIRFFKTTGFLTWYSTYSWLSDRNLENWVGVLVEDQHVRRLWLQGWFITGEVDWGDMFVSLSYCHTYDLQDNVLMTGDLGNLTMPNTLRVFRVGLSYQGYTGPDITISDEFTVSTAIEELSFQETQISAAELTRIIKSVHNGIGTYTYETPALNVYVTGLDLGDAEGGDLDMIADLVASGWTVTAYNYGG